MLLLYLCCFVSIFVLAASVELCYLRRNRAAARRANARGIEGRIAGGKEVESITKYPFAVQIMYFGTYCGGAIISDRYILSSAQCLEYEPLYNCIDVLAGDVVQGQGTKIPIEKAGVHPEWDRPRYAHDIGYMRSASPIEFSDAIQPTRLHYEEELSFTVIGWGEHGEYDGRRLNVMNELVMTENIEILFCQTSYPNLMLIGVICAETADMDGGICELDAGDPAVNRDGSLIALASFSRGCGLGQGPSVFTYLHTREMRDYVEETTGVQYDYK